VTLQVDDSDEDGPWFDVLAGKSKVPISYSSRSQALALREVLQSRKTLFDQDIPKADEQLFLEILDAVRLDAVRLDQSRDRDEVNTLIPLASANEYSDLAVRSVWRSARSQGEIVSAAIDTVVDAARLDQSKGGSEANNSIPLANAIEYSVGSQDLSKKNHYSDTSRTNGWKVRLRNSTRRTWFWGVAASALFTITLTFQLMSGIEEDDSSVLRSSSNLVIIDADPQSRLAALSQLLTVAGATPESKTQKDGTVIITVSATQQALDALGSERIYPVPADGKIVVVIQKPGPRKP
jgi:hypothetical protein